MTTYTKFKEYIWLVNTIYHAKAITLAEINERWLKTDMSEGMEMARTTFYRHKLADYVCSKTSKSTIRFTDADRMVVGELFK